MRVEAAALAILIVVACAPSDSNVLTEEKRMEEEVSRKPAAKQPHVVTPDGETITLEIARTDAQRARGLMFRENLPRNHGMLFIFTESERHGFWMKNTFIPLDIIWIGEDGTIAEVMPDVPPCFSDPCPTYAPSQSGRYVLELAAGEAERLGLSAGDRVELRNIETPGRG
ncbi:MAG: DUF192 domain-containing protein [Thermoanaerobaculia bacterium]|nr:DUF192 domain-containing protein [Thermoanaerobaculia bacterium]